MKNKKGEALTLNVIVIAALALIVLVVLIMVFTGRIGIFQQGVEKEGQAELVKMKVQYGQCRPSTTMESSFVSEFAKAESDEAKESAKATLSEEISRCKVLGSDKVNCEGASCKWS